MDIEVIKVELQELKLFNVQRALKDLTQSEIRVLGAIVSYIKKNTYSPTLTDLGEMLGITKQSVSLFVKNLEKKGYIRRIGRGRIEVTYKDVEITIEAIDKLRPALEELRKLYDDGLITQEQLEQKQKAILKIA